MPIELRAIRSRGREFRDVYDLLSLAFPEADTQMFIDQHERDSTFRLRHGRVAVEDGLVLAYVRIFARTMLVRGVAVAAGGIGSVATLPDVRGSGIAMALLEDAIGEMRREGMAVSFLFTGIPGFYERLGYEIVRQPHFDADRRDLTSTKPRWYYHHRMTDLSKDMPQLLAIHRQAIAGTTGAVVRTKQRWLDARWWLGEWGTHSFIASRDKRPVAYLRSHCRAYGHRILEAECRPGHDSAIRELVETMAFRQCACARVVAQAPRDHPLSSALRALPSTVETTDVAYPMMMRVVSEEALRRALPDVNDLSIGALFPDDKMRFWNSDRI